SFSTLPVTPTRALRCMYRIPATAIPTTTAPIANAAGKRPLISQLFHDAHHLAHRLVRRRDQRSIEDMRFEAHFPFVTVLTESRKDGLPVFLFGTLGHDALAFHLHIQYAVLRQDAVSVGVRLLLAVGIVRIPIDPHPARGYQLHDVGEFRGTRDILRAFVLDQEVD